jgi:hypothetical protein
MGILSMAYLKLRYSQILRHNDFKPDREGDRSGRDDPLRQRGRERENCCICYIDKSRIASIHDVREGKARIKIKG